MSARSIARVLAVGAMTMLCGSAIAAQHAVPGRATQVSAFIGKDDGGLDIRVKKGRVVVRAYIRTQDGWRIGHRVLQVNATETAATQKAIATFREVRNRIRIDQHFPFSEEELLAAAIAGVDKAAVGTPTVAELYSAATDMMVEKLQETDHWARVETREENVARSTPQANNVTAHRLPGDVLMVKLLRFRGPVSEAVAKEIANAKQHGALKGIVIDLRGNGGGLVPEAHALVSQFITPGQPLVTTEYGHLGAPNRTEVLESLGHGAATDTTTPIALLVDGHSASASELTAGILKQAGRVKLFGDRTFGKGVGQSEEKLPDGRLFQQTEWRRKLTGIGAYHGIGIAPDVETHVAEAELDAAAKRGTIRSRGDRLMRAALIHLWSQADAKQ